jgi:hypothetical protein
MERKEYNGWTNYETWNAALWLDNDQGSYNYWCEQAQECYANAEPSSSFTKEEQAVLDLADMLKSDGEERAEQWMPDQSSFFADMLNAALSEVNWHEIAEHYISDVEKDEAA